MPCDGRDERLMASSVCMCGGSYSGAVALYGMGDVQVSTAAAVRMSLDPRLEGGI